MIARRQPRGPAALPTFRRGGAPLYKPIVEVALDGGQ